MRQTREKRPRNKIRLEKIKSKSKRQPGFPLVYLCFMCATRCACLRSHGLCLCLSVCGAASGIALGLGPPIIYMQESLFFHAAATAAAAAASDVTVYLPKVKSRH